MAKVQYYAAASLDGFIARPDGDIDWLQTYGAEADLGDGPMQDGSMDEFYDGVGALVMGSATYEWVLEHAKQWPYDLPTWVFTSRELPQPPGGEVRFTSERRRSRPRRTRWKRRTARTSGWSAAATSPRAGRTQGLIDEIIVTVVPVFIGEGLPFFAGAVQGELRHVNTKTHANGMVELTYRMPQ